MKTKVITNAPKMKNETVNMNSAELSDEELAQVSGGVPELCLEPNPGPGPEPCSMPSDILNDPYCPERKIELIHNPNVFKPDEELEGILKTKNAD